MSEFNNSYINYIPDLINYNNDKIKTKTYTTKSTASTLNPTSTPTSNPTLNPTSTSCTTEYKILNYDEDFICDNDDTLGIYRSIVVNPLDSTLLCFTPPKTMTLPFFKLHNPQIEKSDEKSVNEIIVNEIIVNEIIEGTMITLFYDKRIESWEIATKSAIGGNYWFYRTQYKQMKTVAEQPTFRKMFLEALGGDEQNQDINDLLQDLSKEFCYNFVLQHPANHIVLRIISPLLYLVSVYHLHENVATEIPINVYEKWECFSGEQIQFPRRFEEESDYDQLEAKYCSVNSPYNKVGLMFTNIKTGMRSALENPTYKEVKELRGNNPNLQYQYLCLLRMGKVMDFLLYFPQYKPIFYRFYKEYQEFITNVHQSYISYYIRKSGQTISKKYFPLIYKLHHEVYLPSLAEGKEKIIMRRGEIGKQLGQLLPSELIYYLNYNKEEANIV
jgi:hypothetical protein